MATCHLDHLPGDPLRLRRGEEGRGAGNVGRHANAPQRDLPGHFDAWPGQIQGVDIVDVQELLE